MLRSFKFLAIVLFLTGCTPGTLKYFPAVNGIVVNKGTPIENAKISILINSQVMGGDLLQQDEETDLSGNFHLMESSKFYLLYGPHFHTSTQTLLIRVNGVTYVGIDGERSHISDFEEDMVIDMVCDISAQQANHTIKELNGNRYHDDNNYSYIGICMPG